MDTLLVLSGIGIPEWSTRNATQTLTLMPSAGAVRQTVNGRMIDIGAPQFKKYASTIVGRDLRPPALDAIFPGSLVTVDCVVELSYETLTAGPNRTIVPGSSRVEGDFTFYRPRLNMMVVNHQVGLEEWSAFYNWTIDLVEDLVA